MSIEVNNLTVRYSTHTVIRSLSLTINAHEFVAIMGANGSGKTSLLYALNGVIPHMVPAHMEGTVVVDGQDTRTTTVSELAHTVGTVFQDPDLMLFQETVYDEVAFGLANRNIPTVPHRVADALKKVGLENCMNTDPSTLSEGQKQKLCIAIALALNTSYLLLDEPTAHLDYPSSIALYRQIGRLHKDGTGIVAIEHDSEWVQQHASRVIILSEGTIAADGPPSTVLRNTKLLRTLGIRPLCLST